MASSSMATQRAPRLPKSWRTGRIKEDRGRL
jgi:hypothetical protein